MSGIKHTIERFFEQLARRLYRHPRKSLLVLMIMTGALAWQLPELAFDTSSESLLHKNDPFRLQYDRFREEFGQDRKIILGIIAPDIFTPGFLRRLQSLHREIEAEVPYLKKVDSLVTARRVSGRDDALKVGELLEGWPETLPEGIDDMSALRDLVMANPFYRNHFVSEDGTMAAVVIETRAVVRDQPGSEEDVLSGFSDGNFSVKAAAGREQETRYISAREIRDVVAVIEDIIPRYEAPDFSISFSGSPVVVDIFNRAVAEDMIRCAVLALLTIAFFMGLLFRRISGVVIPLLVVLASVVSALGMMALFKVDIKIMTAILPVFILCVGVADAVHILTIFFREYRGDRSREDAIGAAMAHSGLPVLLTSLTTAAGLLSFSLAEISAIGEMGIFSAVGVVMALIYSVCLIPPLVGLLPLKPGSRGDVKSLFLDRMLGRLADLAAAHPVKIAAGCGFLLLVALAALPGLRYVDHMLNYFPEGMKVRHDIMLIDEKLKGIISFEAIVDKGEENGLYEPDALQRIDTAIQRLKAMETSGFGIQKVYSLNDIVKEIHQAMHDDDPAFYQIPDRRDIIAQELFLFELSGADELEPIVDTGFSRTRLSIKVPWLDSMGLYRLSSDIRGILETVFEDSSRISLTGLSVILARTLPATLNSMYESYVLAAVVITLLMIFLVGSFKVGLLSMFPNLLPVLMVMAGMAVFNIHLDMTSLMIGSIAIGLVVDDTMHFIYNFRRFYDRTGDHREAVRLTLLGTGRAMLTTSLVLAGGFLTLTAATLPHLSRFGILLAIVILLALVVDFVLAPALMVLVSRKEARRREASGRVPPESRPTAPRLETCASFKFRLW